MSIGRSAIARDPTGRTPWKRQHGAGRQLQRGRQRESERVEVPHTFI
jgi:hypothetical protein